MGCFIDKHNTTGTVGSYRFKGKPLLRTSAVLTVEITVLILAFQKIKSTSSIINKFWTACGCACTRTKLNMQLGTPAATNNSGFDSKHYYASRKQDIMRSLWQQRHTSSHQRVFKPVEVPNILLRDGYDATLTHLGHLHTHLLAHLVRWIYFPLSLAAKRSQKRLIRYRLVTAITRRNCEISRRHRSQRCGMHPEPIADALSRLLDVNRVADGEKSENNIFSARNAGSLLRMCARKDMCAQLHSLKTYFLTRFAWNYFFSHRVCFVNIPFDTTGLKIWKCAGRIRSMTHFIGLTRIP